MERKSNVAQRVVAVVALGAALWFVGSYLTSVSAFTGWTGYAPLQSALSPHDRLSPLGNLLLWIGIVIVWFAVSVFLLRPRIRVSSRDPVRQPGASGPVGIGEDADRD